jgi:hypothetical protein
VVVALIAQLHPKEGALRVPQVAQQACCLRSVERATGRARLWGQGHNVEAKDELIATVLGQRQDCIQGALVEALIALRQRCAVTGGQASKAAIGEGVCASPSKPNESRAPNLLRQVEQARV